MTTQTKTNPPEADKETGERLIEYADIEGLDVEYGLTLVRGNKKKYVQLVTLFADFHSPDLARIPLMLSEKDMDSLKQLVHTLKGSAVMIGATLVADVAARLHAAIVRVAEQSDLENAGTELVEQLRTLIVEIRRASDSAYGERQ